MSEELTKCCGTCRSFERTRKVQNLVTFGWHTEGDCGARIPDSLSFAKPQTMREQDGQTCPCYEVTTPHPA